MKNKENLKKYNLSDKDYKIIVDYIDNQYKAIKTSRNTLKRKYLKYKNKYLKLKQRI
jgi:5-bromo-4-chloroindolyl phosphate hydrolysis protein